MSREPLRRVRRILSALCGFLVFSVSTGLAADAGRLAEVKPELVGMDSARLARVDQLIEAAIRDGATPGAALAIGRHGKLVRLRGYGRIDWAPDAPRVTDSTLFDLSSLTKVVGTTTAAMRLSEAGLLSLDAYISHYLPYWPKHGRAGQIRVRHLLTHTSGLPAGYDLWTGKSTRSERVRKIARLPVRWRPGTRTLYSDLGMILLGDIVERIMGQRLDVYLERRVFGPLGMRDTGFNPTRPGKPGFPVDLSRIAPSELDLFGRGRHIHGEVHDPNAYALGGVAGHAGLFSSARDLAIFAQEILNGVKGGHSRIASSQTIRRFTTRNGSGRPLGWDFPEGPKSSAGRYLSARAFGHTGFTGTSIWIDPELDLFVVLLTNRVNPTAANTKHHELRRAVHDATALAITDMPIAVRPDAREGDRTTRGRT
ncbi:MAG TPA: serine hydrolase [Longimicrobiales bacterium]